MTTREKQLVRESFRCLREEAGPLSLLFYGRLFELDPLVRPMFHGDIGRQGQKLMTMLAVVIDSLDHFDALAPGLQAMGQRHTSYGVIPRHYAIVEQALVWALCQSLTTQSNSETIAAWRTLIREVSAVMQAGADELHTALGSRADGVTVDDLR